MKTEILDLLRDCFADEVAHLELRMIRDAQAPRFEVLRESHPEIYEDFMSARSGPHEILLTNRRKRIKVLTKIIENFSAILVCEHCNSQQELKSGYDDAHYHDS